MGRKLDALLGRKSRQMSKLKTLLGLTVSRLAVLRNRRQVRCNQARTDVAQLLQLGHVDHALLRVEHVIKEQNMVDVFVMSEHYCQLLIERFVLLDHKECPEELREAISSLSFAASRCAELPELDKARGIFSSRYGKELVSAAVELRNNCRVNPKMIQKLSTRQPSLEIRQRVTKEIAAETGINLDFYDPSSEDAGVRIPIHPNSSCFASYMPCLISMKMWPVQRRMPSKQQPLLRQLQGPRWSSADRSPEEEALIPTMNPVAKAELRRWRSPRQQPASTILLGAQIRARKKMGGSMHP